MNTAFVLRCDGRREFIEQTVASVEKHVRGAPFAHGFIIDDSADPDYAAWLDITFPFLKCIHHEQRRGLGGCFKSAIDTFLGTTAQWLFSVEDDTPILRDVMLTPMADVLNANHHLSQLMFMRPPFNQAEINAGGVYQQDPDAFTERTNGTEHWVTHSKWFGFQPFLAKRNVIEHIVERAENFLELGVTEPLKAAGYHFGYWGALDDPPLCDHIGTHRAQGYHW